MTQHIAKDIETGRILYAVGRPDPVNFVGPPSPPPAPRAGVEYHQWEEEISFDSAPSKTSVFEWRDGPVWVEAAPLDELKVRKNAQINQWRAAANQSTFPFGDKLIDCDALSRSDIDAVANHVGLFGEFPDGFPMAWKTADNDYIPLRDLDAFKAMYRAMTAQGTANFDRSEALKVALGNATDAAEVAAIAW